MAVLPEQRVRAGLYFKSRRLASFLPIPEASGCTDVSKDATCRVLDAFGWGRIVAVIMVERAGFEPAYACAGRFTVCCL